MNDIIFSLNNNSLKLTIIEKKDGFKSIECDLPTSVVLDTKILDMPEFVRIVQDLIAKLTRVPKSKLTISFISHPQDGYLRFMTVSKADDDLESQLIKEVKEKFSDVNIEKLYFTYTKIAPFVYQFIGVEKDYLENFIELAQRLNIELRGVYPWVMLLPKYLNINDPAIFVAKVNNEQVVALSELNGIFFTGVYEIDKTSQELDKLVRELSVYKRNQPISKIYTLNYEGFSPENGFEIYAIDIPNSNFTNSSGYEVNLLLNYLLDLNKDLPDNHINLLHLLPLPVVVKKSTPMVYVGVAAGVLVAVFGVLGFFVLKNNNSNVSSAGETANNQDQQIVLGGTSVNNQQQTQPEQGKVLEPENKDLKKEELKIRVENGSGINGAAGNMQKTLQSIGYNVVEIDTANELRSDTLLRFKPSKSTYKDLISADLKEKTAEQKIEANLEESSTYDLLIIIGSSVNF